MILIILAVLCIVLGVKTCISIDQDAILKSTISRLEQNNRELATINRLLEQRFDDLIDEWDRREEP